MQSTKINWRFYTSEDVISELKLELKKLCRIHHREKTTWKIWV